MGDFDENIASAQQMLDSAEAEYADAVRTMADASPSVREFVLAEIQGRIDEAKWMIDTFTKANG